MTVVAPPAGIHLRPRARGWIHLYSAALAAAAGVVLIVLAFVSGGARAGAACLVYTLASVGLFAVSATYHRHVWTSVRTRAWMKRADHSMIFLFIAGTYTPIAVLALAPPTRTVVLLVVWLGAAGGVILKMLFPHAPRWLGVPIYLALGWVAIFVMPDLVHSAGVAAVVLIGAGGLLYTAGALCYALRRPNPWPLVFGYHEFFHAAVSLAALCHCVAIWLVLYHS